jgi:hypothetical protein
MIGKRECIALVLLMATIGVEAKDKWPYRDTVMLINGPRVLESPFRKRRFDFSLDARRTLIGAQGAKLGGLRIGLEYRRIHRVGIGFFGLSEEAELQQLQSLNPNVSIALLNLKYTSIYYERVLYFNRKWEWSATLHLGNGQIEGRYQLNDSDEWIDLPAIHVKPLELSTSAYYHLNWWVSLGLGGGYRYMRQTPTEAKVIYNAPVALFKVKIRFVKLIKGAFNPAVRDQY